jgi:hypothetical protein
VLWGGPCFITTSNLHHQLDRARVCCHADMLSSLLFLLFNALITSVSASTGYQERLLLRPLPHGTLLASFNFVSNETKTAFEQQNFGYFPRSFGQILQHAHAKELHLRFSVGRWDAESWGQRPSNGAREGGTGVELWAWVEADTEEEYGSMRTACRESMLTQAEHSHAGSHLPMPSPASFARP